MTISGALQTSITGLTGQSNAIGFISDNVANATTLGYKKVESRFSTLVTSSSAQSNIHSPGGSLNQPFFANNAQGAIQQVTSTTSVAVSGGGFIPVSKKNGTDTSTGLPTFETTSYYTRVGDFIQNEDGYLVNSAGYFLRAFELTEDATTGAVTRSATASEVRVSNLLDSPVATTNVEYSANLPANAVDPSTGTTPADLSTNSIQIFDALGNAQTLDLDWTRTGTNAWSLTITAANSTPSSFGPITIDFGGLFGGAGATSATPGTISNITTADANVTPATISAQADDASFELAMDFGNGSQTVTLDLGAAGETTGTTQFAGTTLALNDFAQNGVPRGNFKSLAINNNGEISVTFDNGNVKSFYQVQLAKFRDPTELDRVDGNAYLETPGSGSAVLTDVGGSGVGSLVSAAIEQSNVDIAEEFSKMIVAQRAYSANARLVTVADELLQETINIRR